MSPDTICLAHQYSYCDWNSIWDALKAFNKLSIWSPPPKIACQVITLMSEIWSECPLTSPSLFFVPQTVPTSWWGLSPHVIELPAIYPHLTPLWYLLHLSIPIAVLYLPRHGCSLSTKNRLPIPSIALWHRGTSSIIAWDATKVS
jgi:hypothetical protein